MKLNQIAIQLYSLRDFCKTAADYAATLRRVREIGYRGIQISGVGPIPASELRSIAEGEGLAVAATHEPFAAILDEPQKVSDRLAELGTRYTALPYPAGVDFSDAAAVARMIGRADAAGAVLRAAGCVLTYHNHALELYRLNGKTILESIYEGTRPENLQGEIDTYWIQAGGGNPVEWVARLRNRLPLLHLKDYGVDAAGKAQYTEIGYGNLDFKAIVREAALSGTEWYIVEQDSTPGDPFESVKMSFDYIKTNLIDPA